jgi:hypothetical protein
MSFSLSSNSAVAVTPQIFRLWENTVDATEIAVAMSLGIP